MVTQESQKLQEILQKIAERCQESSDLNEREVIDLFVSRGFFATLGYSTPGEDLRLEQRLGKGRADVILRGVTGRPICIIEFKRPATDLTVHIAQLKEYVKELLPEYAALTNGTDFWLYRRLRDNLEELKRFSLGTISVSQVDSLYQILRKRAIDWNQLDSVKEALENCRTNPVYVTRTEEEGGKIFLGQFALSPHAAFGRLTKELFENLSPLLDRSGFTRGAYAFWEKIYARSLDDDGVDKLARAWEAFVTRDAKEQTIYRFMFALETAYAILSRLLLAKAMQDADFPQLDVIKAFYQKLDEEDSHGCLELKDYVPAVLAVFKEGKKQAFQSLFASDIFDWWLDLPQLDRAAYPALEALAEATLAVFQFNFSKLSGDLLGQLYQSYFDPETRKALGEFYTPPEVVEFILDHVGYQGPDIAAKRLLDPACGSGTFLVYALKRYLEVSPGTVKEKLQSLRDGFRIVGFDINPFAVLMAQVNYALHLLPAYAQVLKDDREFEIPTLPVFRTDSLRHEKREGEREQIEEKHGNKGFTFEAKGDIAKIKTELPIEVKPGKFLKVEVHVPRFDRAKHHGWVDNVEEYFKVQHAMFAAVRQSQERGASPPTVDVEELRTILSRLNLAHAPKLAKYIHPAAQEILNVLKRLEREYKDGRFLKTLEDLVLAMTLKHELQYDFVVGNPPYVRVQNIPELSRKYWQGIYGWAEGNFDIFIPFIERAVVYWLKEGGRLGLICSDRFLLANYAQKLREQLPQLTEIELIFDLRDTRVFKDALNYPAVLIARRTDSPKRETFVGARVFDDPGEEPRALLDEARAFIQDVQKKGPYILGKHADAFTEQTANLTRQGWYLMPPKERRVFHKLEEAATHRLHELTRTPSGGFQGLATGCDDVFILKLIEDQGKVWLLKPKGGGDPVEIEKELLRPWLFGRDVERWHIAWDGWYVLFPYVKIDGVYKLIPSKDNAKLEPFKFYADKAPRMEDFSKAWKYLRDHEKNLRGREDGRFVHDWYGAARPQNLEFYEMPKLVVQINSKFSDMAYDSRFGFVFQAGGRGGGVYGIALDLQKIDPWFALALLNSIVLDFYLKHISTVYFGHTYSYSDAFIKNLPIRLPKTKTKREIAKKLAKIAQKLTKTKGKLRAKELERAAFPELQISQLKKRPELYPVSRLAQGRLQATQICVEDVSLQQRLDQSWTLRFGRNELIFPTRTHAELARTWLMLQGRDQVESDRLMSLRLPQDGANCKKLLDLLKKADKKIEKLQKILNDGEEEVNELVAHFYSLNKKDRKIIREFLERF